jgi:hypothetical protein
LPTAYAPFLSAVATASAALIGLLFVAVTVDPERVRHQAREDRQLNAGMAFFAFVDTLFVSLSGLLPGASAAATSRVLGAIGVIVTVGVARAILARRRDGALPRILTPLTALTALVYAAQVAASQVVLDSPTSGWALGYLCSTLMILLVVGIMRSWELLGLRQQSPDAGRSAERPEPGTGRKHGSGSAAAGDRP